MTRTHFFLLERQNIFFTKSLKYLEVIIERKTTFEKINRKTKGKMAILTRLQPNVEGLQSVKKAYYVVHGTILY